jgi:mRNA interferase MazF
MNFRLGDVVSVLYRDSNNEKAQLRLALVVQADQPGTGLPQTVVAMITSNMARAGHPSRVVVIVNSQGASGSGLLMDSVIMTDNLATVHESEIERVIGQFARISDLDDALRVTLKLSQRFHP